MEKKTTYHVKVPKTTKINPKIYQTNNALQKIDLQVLLGLEDLAKEMNVPLGFLLDAIKKRKVKMQLS